MDLRTNIKTAPGEYSKDTKYGNICLFGMFWCLFVCPIITHDPIDWFASNFDWKIMSWIMRVILVLIWVFRQSWITKLSFHKMTALFLGFKKYFSCFINYMNAYCTLNIMLGRFFIPKFADRYQDKQSINIHHTSFYNTVLDVIL